MTAPEGGPPPIPGSSSTVLADGKYNSWPGLTRTSGGTLWGSYSRGASHMLSWDNEGYVTSSTDGGASWAAGTRLSPAASAGTVRYYSGGIHVLVSGRIVYVYGQETQSTGVSVPYVRYTDNNGSSWSAAAALPTFSRSFAFGSQSLFQHSGGRLFAVGFGTDTSETAGNYKVGVLYSDDNGGTWSGPVVVGPANSAATKYNEASLIEKPNGDLVMFVRSEANALLYRSVSTDQGATWSTPASMGFAVVAGMPTGLVYSTSNTVFLVYRQSNKVAFRWSQDYGVTWQPENTLDSLPYEYAGAARISSTSFGVLYAVDSAPGQDNVNPGQANLKYAVFNV